VRVGSGELLENLHVRDRPLLERTGSFGDTPATMSTRPGLLLVRFQPFTAVIGESCALLMDAHRASSKAAAGAIAASAGSAETKGDGDDENDAHAFVRAIGAAASADLDGRSHAGISLPPGVARASSSARDFPLRALEAVLNEATDYYHQKMRRIKLLTDYCLETITEELKTPGWGPGTGEAGFQRLLPLRRAMTELESDIREAHHAISDAMRDDARIDGLLPGGGADAADAEDASDPFPPDATPGGTRHDTGTPVAKRLASKDGAADARDRDRDRDRDPARVARRAAVTSLLQTHLWRVRAAGGQLSEMSRQVEATREVWELYLDGVRNRTVRLNLQATVATLALTVAAVPASLAGMNVPNGFEDASPVLFWSVATALGGLSGATFWSFMRHGSSARKGLAGARVDDLRALRFVLQSMDELDDAMRGATSTTKKLKKDKESLLRALAASAGDDGRLAKRVAGLDDAALNLLFRVFDLDADGSIDPSSEWVIRPWPVEDEGKRETETRLS
jgi:magnesium transporter